MWKCSRPSSVLIMVNTAVGLEAADAGKDLICRLCMQRSEGSFNIFVSDAIRGMAVREVMPDLLNIEVVEGDGLPDSVCHQCFWKLMEFIEFKEMCLRTSIELRKSIQEDGLNRHVKTEGDLLKSLDERETYKLENCRKDEAGEKPVTEFAFVPLDTGHSIGVEEEDIASGSVGEEETYSGEQLGQDGFQGIAVNNVEQDPLDVGNLILVKEEMDLDESQYEEETVQRECFEEYEGPVFDVVCVPHEEGNLVDGGSNTKSSQWSSSQMLKESRAEKQGNEGFNLKRKISDHCNSPSQTVGNDSARQYLYWDFVGTIQGDSCKGQSKVMGTNILKGIKTNEKRYEFENVGSEKNQFCEGDEYICNECGFKCPDKMTLSTHVFGHIMSKRIFICKRPEKNISLEGSSKKRAKIDGHLKPYMLEKCGMVLTQSHTLMQNIVSHTRLKPFTCDTCGKGFSQKGKLTQHIVSHSELKPFNCKECGKGFTQKSNLLNHILLHSGHKPFKCVKCGKGFPRKIELNQHKAIHSGHKPFCCEECGKGFTWKSYLLNHILTHSGVKPFKCKTCGKCFARKGNLTEHEVTHSEIKPFNCEECGKGFARKSNLLTHILMHSGLKPFKCVTCGEGFAQQNQLMQHEAIHSGLKPFSCEECGKGFARKSNLLNHILMHSGLKPFKCETCGKCFARKGNLTEHEVTHSEIKPFNCEECGKGYYQKGSLLKHLMIHSGLKPFKCETCGKGFSRKDILIRHNGIHSRLKTFICDERPKPFWQYSPNFSTSSNLC